MTLKQTHGSAAPARGMPDIERGMILMTTCVIMAPGVHAIAKGLGDTMSPGQVAFARFSIQLLLLIPLVWVGRTDRIPRPTISQAVRGFLLAVAGLSFFTALTYMPLAESSAIFFVEPLILTLLSAMFLGEPIGWRRVVAVAVGFAGALIVIRPSFEQVGPAALLPLVAAFCFATYLTITRRQASHEDARVLQLWVCFFASLTLAVAMLLSSELSWTVASPSWPAGTEWSLLAGIGVIGTAVHMLAIAAFHRAPASILAPFQYLEILGATVLGVIFFSDWPDGATILGIAIIVGSGLYVFRREQASARDSVRT